MERVLRAREGWGGSGEGWKGTGRVGEARNS